MMSYRKPKKRTTINLSQNQLVEQYLTNIKKLNVYCTLYDNGDKDMGSDIASTIYKLKEDLNNIKTSKGESIRSILRFYSSHPAKTNDQQKIIEVANSKLVYISLSQLGFEIKPTLRVDPYNQKPFGRYWSNETILHLPNTSGWIKINRERLINMLRNSRGSHSLAEYEDDIYNLLFTNFLALEIESQENGQVRVVKKLDPSLIDTSKDYDKLSVYAYVRQIAFELLTTLEVVNVNKLIA